MIYLTRKNMFIDETIKSIVLGKIFIEKLKLGGW